MDPKRWKQVDEVLQSALDRSADEREAFLRDACGGDDALEREVRSLILLDESADGFLSRPAIEGAVRHLASEADKSLIGRVFGRYRIVGKLGAGGMGVVYKAEDLELKRFAALKFLSGDLAGEPESLSRFRREARAASALNHPNICTIHDFGEQGGQAYIVMEFLEGLTLKQRIAQSRIPEEELTSLASEIASGLEAADQAGIIHRDIKPANIFLTKLGHAKILDFGIAKVGEEPALDAAGGTATMQTELTNPGSAIGTAPYMSPEQVRSQVLDRRTDLFSFGVVLYEMAAGTLPFRGSNGGEIMRAILDQVPPDFGATPELTRIIRKCLEKDRERRYQSAAEIRADLRIFERSSGGSGVVAMPQRRRGISLAVAGALLSVAVAAAVGYFALLRKPVATPKLTDRDTVVLADFKNTTGDTVFDLALRQAVSTQLEQSPFLVLVNDRKIKATLAMMQKPSETRLTPEIAREVCQRTGGSAVIDGRIDPVGSKYLLGLTARACRTGESFYSEQVLAGGKEEVIGALQKMSTKLRQRAGESLVSIKEYSAPPDEVTTPSFEALTAYSTGRATISKGPRMALEFFKRAVEIDPEFPSANAFLGSVYASLGDAENAGRYCGKAYEMRSRASEHERYFIEFNYQLRALGNLEQAEETAKLWAQRYPRDVMPESFLCGSTMQSTGKYEQSEQHAKRSIELDADNAYGYHNLANSYICRGRPDEASAVLDQAAARKLDIHEFMALHHQIAFLKNNVKEMARIDALGEEKIGASDWICDLEAGALGYRGHLRESRTKLQRAVSIASGTGRAFAVGQHEAASAVREFLFGNPVEARRAAMAALASGTTDRDAIAGAALALALLGEDAKAEALILDQDRRYPKDTTAQTNQLPALRALIALNRKDPAKALELLQRNVPYELAWVGPRSAGFAMSLYPIYVRGKAYLLLGRPADAAREFLKIVDNLGVVSNEPTVAVAARLELARAWKSAGELAKAKAVYEEFLGLWKDADADIPILSAAKREYDSLK